MAYMPCDINWEKKDFLALAKRLSYAAVCAEQVTNEEELEQYKRMVAVHCQLYLDKYGKNRKNNPL